MLANYLSQLYYFWIAATEGNFTKAARKVFVSQSAISHQIILLEGKLNTQLFDRQKDGVHLTSKGSELFKTCNEIFTKLKASNNHIESHELAGALHITASPQLGNIIVLDAIKRLLKRHNEIEVTLHTTNDILHFSSWKSDITFNYFPLNLADFVNLPVICLEFHLVASPEYLSKNPEIRKPEDVTKHTLLTISEDMPDWHVFLRGYHIEQRIKNLKKISVGNMDATISMAADGFGLVFAPDYILDETIKKGILKKVALPGRPFSHWVFAIFRKKMEVSPRISAFMQIFKETIAKFKSESFRSTDKVFELIDSITSGKEIDISSIVKSHPPLSFYKNDNLDKHFLTTDAT